MAMRHAVGGSTKMVASSVREDNDAPNSGANAPNLGADRDVAPLADALFGKVRRSLLGLFFGHPDEAFYMRQIARVLGLGQGAVHRELDHLADAGILLRETQGRQVYYWANKSCPIYPELHGLVLKTVGLVDVLRSALAPLGERIKVAFVYGSVARGTAKTSSDVDVMIIGTLTLAEAVEALAPAEHALGREVNPTVYPADEFRRKVRSGHHFLNTVVREPRLQLIGDEHDLERLVEERLADAASDQ